MTAKARPGRPIVGSSAAIVPACRAAELPTITAQRALAQVMKRSTSTRCVGGPEVMREQLRHRFVPALGPNPGVPLSAGAYAGLDGPFVIATTSTGEDVVYLDGQRHGQVIDRAEYVRQMVEVWESIRGEALSQQQSLDLIADVAETRS
ncbi:Scr1 family TA system antitoxin-like transcriptional regulator [Micromonospora sp. DT231]|uniref:Scr1 family TA system antitoxin-like transcriptional regulator n=1 Tax=Micromonospora sp. DT231 TaxID=3416526 RepID=UPI003CE7A1E3